MLMERIGKDTLERFPDFGPLDIEDWDDFLEKTKVFFIEHWYKPFKHEETLSDFDQVKLLGNGTYGEVILIKHKEDNKYFAMKAMVKERIVKSKQLDHAQTEKSVLQSINFPLTVYLKYFFKDNTFIYFVMPFIPGGELFAYLRKVDKFDEVQAKFYASQVILALEYLHFLDLVYRDLKPENILIDQTGNLKLTDFGFCKYMNKHRTYTLCGTPEYMAPEVILSKGYAKSVDWWGVGVLVFEMVAGFPPFLSVDSIKLFNKIIAVNYKMPSSFSGDLKDLIKNMLQADLSKRYGNMKNGVKDIKNHKWFREINWMAILNRKVSAKYQPQCSKPGDTGYFEDFSGWKPEKVARENKYAEEFADF